MDELGGKVEAVRPIRRMLQQSRQERMVASRKVTVGKMARCV